MVVGALLGENTHLLDLRYIACLFPCRQRRLDRALRQRADRPALHIGFRDARQRPFRNETLTQYRNALVRLVRELLDESLLSDKRPDRALDTDRRQQAGLQRIADGVATVEALPHRQIAAAVKIARLDLV